MKDKIIALLKTVKRPGIDKLIEFLETSDFFTAPASTAFHGSEEGGLAKHSLCVYELLKEKVKRYDLKTLDESVIIVALAHDFTKVNFYVKGKKWSKDKADKWYEEEIWKVEDKVCLGHGESSLCILQGFIQVTPEEACAIRWHSGWSEAGTHFMYPTG